MGASNPNGAPPAPNMQGLQNRNGFQYRPYQGGQPVNTAGIAPWLQQGGEGGGMPPQPPAGGGAPAGAQPPWYAAELAAKAKANELAKQKAMADAIRQKESMAESSNYELQPTHGYEYSE